jgi:hypothetical protein
MSQDHDSSAMDRLLEPFGRALTPALARALVDLRAPSEDQDRIDELAEKCNEGSLSDEERAEYEDYVRAIHFRDFLRCGGQARTVPPVDVTAVRGSQLTYCVEVAAEPLADVEEQTVRSVHQAQRPERENPSFPWDRPGQGPGHPCQGAWAALIEDDHGIGFVFACTSAEIEPEIIVVYRFIFGLRLALFAPFSNLAAPVAARWHCTALHPRPN